MRFPPLFPLVLTMAWLMGCTTGDEALPSTADALVGQTGPGDGTMMGPAVDRGFGPVVDRGMSTCRPGDRLRLCEECGLDGRPQVSVDDNNCPALDCAAQGQYERAIEGDDVVCYQIGGAPRLPGRCIGPTRCATLEEYCGAPMRVEVQRTRADPCAPMVGCQGNQAPMIQSQPAGTPCNRTGMCQAAGNGGSQCSLQVPGFCRLDDNPAAKFFCESGVENGQQYCEFFVEPPNAGRTRCIDFCQSLGMETCDPNQGEQCCWNNANPDNCDHLEGIICAGEPCMNPQGCQDMICRCYLPMQ